MTNRQKRYDTGDLQGRWDGFETLRLGDMVQLPAEGPLAVRGLSAYDDQSGRSSVFAILGDVDRVLLGRDRDQVTAYVPIDQLPPRLVNGQVVAEGRCGYLAAHVPGNGDGLDVMAWRVLRLAGHLDPVVLLYRGPQLLVFLPVGRVDPATLRVVRLSRGGVVPATRRVSALVDLPAAPTEVLTPRRRPAVLRLLGSHRD
jgi:hypothetical protein